MKQAHTGRPWRQIAIAAVGDGRAPDHADPAPSAPLVASEATPTAATALPATPTGSASPTVAAESPTGVASRLVIPHLGVDLPVVSDLLEVPGNPEGYPLCDVAHYLSYYGQPGEPGTVYLFAHAQAGMLLPLLEASRVDDGEDLLGQVVHVYTSDGWLHVYQIFTVKRHTTDWALADEVSPGEQRLVIQTSEGPSGTPNKLQIAALPISMQKVPPAEALASAAPRACPPPSPEGGQVDGRPV